MITKYEFRLRYKHHQQLATVRFGWTAPGTGYSFRLLLARGVYAAEWRAWITTLSNSRSTVSRPPQVNTARIPFVKRKVRWKGTGI